MVVLSYCCVVILLYCHIVVLLYYCIVILLYCYIFILSNYCYNVVLLYCCYSTSGSSCTLTEVDGIQFANEKPCTQQSGYDEFDDFRMPMFTVSYKNVLCLV